MTKKLPMPRLKMNIDAFIYYARNTPEATFLVTEVGCGLAGFSVGEIAPLFAEAVHVKNIHLPRRFWHKLS